MYRYNRLNLYNELVGNAPSSSKKANEESFGEAKPLWKDTELKTVIHTGTVNISEKKPEQSQPKGTNKKKRKVEYIVFKA